MEDGQWVLLELETDAPYTEVLILILLEDGQWVKIINIKKLKRWKS